MPEDCWACLNGDHQLCDTTAADGDYCGCWADNHDDDEPDEPDDLDWQRDRAEDRTINYLIGE
jgi:hypothetical protein